YLQRYLDHSYKPKLNRSNIELPKKYHETKHGNRNKQLLQQSQQQQRYGIKQYHQRMEQVCEVKLGISHKLQQQQQKIRLLLAAVSMGQQNNNKSNKRGRDI
ncbi:1465_t:CDS:2, partial [Diversispora eburnea]